MLSRPTITSLLLSVKQPSFDDVRVCYSPKKHRNIPFTLRAQIWNSYVRNQRRRNRVKFPRGDED